ncbi:MAG: hypothetical protein WC554_15390 [Clostridia bacterium]
MLKIRHNTDIKYVIIQHTGHIVNVSSEIVNNEYLQRGDYGAPYDIIVSKNGEISLTPRWIRSPYKNNIEINSNVSKIFKYKNHFYSDITPSQYQTNCLNIGVIGNYDVERPNISIFNSLTNILIETLNNLNIDLYTSLLYYSEIYNISSPGVFFYDKSYLLNFVKKTRERRFIPYVPIPDGGGIIVEEPEDTKSYRLLENGDKRLLENGNKRLIEEM